ncbi:MAG: RagB/SusD family nutrient uptake outer membrane protein [Candidatus Pseudobacter hemicellulosilyticus]|uniref:RagB/SusD family nutrient uptake outer membrane protein n=1 Tax=Candidatus Pseudobacter hemicellulosilyticus TaxID=3121375 RepID=A0AAJ5WT01_9BACT|nr:MAG: RagB/SusD family nutrient uptake outer membrane protein [Pseudobacter sp.]
MRAIHYLLITGFAACLFSCTKYEEYPVERITGDFIFDSLDKQGVYATRFVNDLYSYLPTGFNRISNSILDAATDDAIASEYGNQIERLSKSQLNADNNPDGRWATCYTAIRKANQFLANIDIVPQDAQTKTYWKGEVRFIRAMNYFELLKRYGGVPLLAERYYSLADKIDVSRNSFAEVADYIVSECDAILPLLRTDPVTATELGRVTRAGALSLKSRTLLYAASPLNNPANDPARWQLASDAAKAVMDLNKYSLAPSFVNHFTNRSSVEFILGYQTPVNTDLERQNAPVGYVTPNVSQGYISPTQDLVDAFPMANGKPIRDAGSGYNAANPYNSRDPRLAGTVFYNGMQWLNRAVENFQGGLDNPASSVRVARQTRTGYYMRKFLGSFASSAEYSNQSHVFPIFRYTETLLNYAEAQNELNVQTTAYTQLKALRARAGITAGTDGLYGLKANMTQEEMRAAIHLERRLELAFEEHRYWDLRRWKTAEQVLNKDLTGMMIVKNSDNTLSYSTHTVDYVSFLPKQYLYPIPINEVTGSQGKIAQNSGW